MEKGPQAWDIAMEGEQGIVALQDAYFEYMESFTLSAERMTEMRQFLKDNYYVRDTTELHELPFSNIGTLKADRFLWTDLTERGMWQKIVTCASESESEDDVYRLLETGSLLLLVSYEILSSATFDTWTNTKLPEDKKTAYNGLDMGGPKSVVIDNLSTVLNVFRVASHATESTEKEVQIFDILVDAEKGDQHKKETQLQQCARAPFAFWADTRKVIPVSCNGEAIVSQTEGFSSAFLETLHTGKMKIDSDIIQRHGGCPVLHPNFNNGNHINKLGELFIKWHTHLHT